ncbi:hypothetical protein A3F37_01930 [Candidatus Saccharibacteria bacterium RIFCSPHIGHO2_12_FULL_41_12]|nr:MAG: hypothetical protein A3F37_01930 [Candidatus Saccharibacteria bacterium RIFCSPHIGHO2_12_FULL_41_12]
MSEKARGAIFNVLGDVVGLSLLDPYAGSGAIAFEALSRGAKSVVAIDSNKKAYTMIKISAEDLGITEDKMQIVLKNCKVWSDSHPEMTFDIIICDPPYDDIRPDVIRLLSRHLSPKGIFVLSYPNSEKPLEIGNLKVIQTNNYGDNQLIFYKR